MVPFPLSLHPRSVPVWLFLAPTDLQDIRSLAVDLPSERVPSTTKTPSVIPSMVSESDVEPPVFPVVIALPPSKFSPMLSTTSREVELELPAVAEVTHTRRGICPLLFSRSTVSPTSLGQSLKLKPSQLSNISPRHSLYSPHSVPAARVLFSCSFVWTLRDNLESSRLWAFFNLFPPAQCIGS